MSPRKQNKSDRYEEAIEAVLAPGSFISYEAAWSFVQEVEAVAEEVARLIERDPERAARVYEIFIAACHEKAEEIDDSWGDLVLRFQNTVIYSSRSEKPPSL